MQDDCTMLRDELEETILYRAFDALLDEEGRELLEELSALEADDKYAPSKKNDRAIHRMIRRQMTPIRYRRILPLAAALAIAAVMAVTVLGDVKDFVVQVWDRFVSVEAASASGVPDPVDWSGLYVPSYLPSGYAFEEIQPSDLCTIIIYANDAGEQISLAEYTDGQPQLRLDGEDAEHIRQDISINGQAAVLIEKNGIVKIQWGDGPLFILSGPCSQRELLKMARNIQLP